MMSTKLVVTFSVATYKQALELATSLNAACTLEGDQAIEALKKLQDTLKYASVIGSNAERPKGKD